MLQEREARRFFYRMIRGEVPLSEFERWLYDHVEVEEWIGKSAYYDLICIRYADYEDFEFYGDRDKLLEYQQVFRLEAGRLLGFLTRGDIVITNEYQFIDNRREAGRLEQHSYEQIYKDEQP
ncbi:hypothetical protein B5M42_013795 [Paenibacillus athensensis]|uniref:Uncharacterized protein n=1 Tax=Paenibacillus athensensis TaxID=1967502 RepID=A0A4Y8PYI9_9BACL|nr:hypothetical protein [Paenibacillus athensensis]MCD1259905.1 hypothetical protein [Paenibacillus athensensis]